LDLTPGEAVTTAHTVSTADVASFTGSGAPHDAKTSAKTAALVVTAAVTWLVVIVVCHELGTSLT
jgi:hypothetical protein